MAWSVFLPRLYGPQHSKLVDHFLFSTFLPVNMLIGGLRLLRIGLRYYLMTVCGSVSYINSEISMSHMLTRFVDMNEPSSFCDGSCGSGVDPQTLVTTQALVPVISEWPEVCF